MKGQDIDVSDNSELDEQFFGEAIRCSAVKQQINLRLDPVVLAHFEKRGHGCQTAINGTVCKCVGARKVRAPWVWQN
jgi:uncharacterized protein (DUF4415 family)